MSAAQDGDRDFQFECPSCALPLETTAELVDKELNCPNCGKGIRVPAPPQTEVVAVKAASWNEQAQQSPSISAESPLADVRVASPPILRERLIALRERAWDLLVIAFDKKPSPAKLKEKQLERAKRKQARLTKDALVNVRNMNMKYLRPVLILTAILALGFGVKIAINHYRNPHAAGTPKEIARSKLAAVIDASEHLSKNIETVKTAEDFANALNQYMDKFEPFMSPIASDIASDSVTDEQMESLKEFNNWMIKNASAQESLWIAIQNLSVKFNTSPKAVEAYSRVEKMGKEEATRLKKALK